MMIALTLSDAGAQALKIDRCEPTSLRSGGSTEIKLHGPGLELAQIWTSFPAQIERIDEKAARFRVTTDFVGSGAIRAHGDQGASNLFFVQVEPGGDDVITSQNRLTKEDAQVLPLPAKVTGQSAALGSCFYRFTAKAGESVVVHARDGGRGFDGVIKLRAAASGNQVAFNDDSEVYGADPWLKFLPPADGDYLVELLDSQFRGGLPFVLEIGRFEHVPKPSIAEGLGNEAMPISFPGMVHGRFETGGDQDSYRFSVHAGTFLTIRPMGRSVLSPAMPRVKLTDGKGKPIAETPADTFDERVLRVFLKDASECLLQVTEALGGHGEAYFYAIDLDADSAPFDLSIPRQGDKNRPLLDQFVAVPGGVFAIPIQCLRHGFDGPIALKIESDAGFTETELAVGAKKGDANLRLQVPEQLGVGSLAQLRLVASGVLGERTYTGRVRTGAALQERQSGIAEVPQEIDGALALKVIESPVAVEVIPPGEIEKGGVANIPVKLVWRDEKRKFNTTLRVVGAPDGVQVPEKKLNSKDTTTGIELKLGNVEATELNDLRVEVTLDFHRQALIVQSEPFTIRISEKIEEHDKKN